jgi:hypothetical protein
MKGKRNWRGRRLEVKGREEEEEKWKGMDDGWGLGRRMGERNDGEEGNWMGRG